MPTRTCKGINTGERESFPIFSVHNCFCQLVKAQAAVLICFSSLYEWSLSFFNTVPIFLLSFLSFLFLAQHVDQVRDTKLLDMLGAENKSNCFAVKSTAESGYLICPLCCYMFSVERNREFKQYFFLLADFL